MAIRGWRRAGTAARAAAQLPDGSRVDLRIGSPTVVPNYAPEGVDLVLQSENCILGVGACPGNVEDPALIDAGKQTVTVQCGASLFNSASSFGMIRGRRIAAAILRAMPVSRTAGITSWMISEKLVRGMGGAIGLDHGTGKAVVPVEHVAEDALPYTGAGVVQRIITELAVIDVTSAGVRSVECVSGVTDDVHARTEPVVL
ncbi:succinyl-CoA--3-ketoacid-CoA transferase [Rhodococcus sp. WS4]|nr:succinyl-CoA--3-ketoacid-CoA transferase [Rhodococcus sp. WS4]